MRLRVKLIGATVAIIILGAIGWWGWVFFGHVLHDYFSRRTFEPVAWQTAKPGSDAIRIRMVDDLLRRHRFQGYTRNQVTAFLGNPDRTNFMGGATYQQDNDVAYWLGPERGFISIDSEWLLFRLDSSNIVKGVQIVTD